MNKKKNTSELIVTIILFVLLIASVGYVVKGNASEKSSSESTSLIAQKDFLYGDSYLNNDKTSAYTVLLMTCNYEKMKNCSSIQIEGKLNETSKIQDLNMLSYDIWFCDHQNWDFCIYYSLDELNRISGYSNTCQFGVMFSGVPLNSLFKMRSIYTLNDETIYSEWWEFEINDKLPLASDSQYRRIIPN